MTDDIIEEWNRHRSATSVTWRVAMTARRRFRKVLPVNCSDIRLTLEKSSLFSLIEVAAIEKDLHLVAAVKYVDRAMPASNRAVLSLDETMRGLLRRLSTETHALDHVQWANPTNDFERIHAWLAGEIRSDPRWRLTDSTARKTAPNRP
jgi:hypothetical protein